MSAFIKVTSSKGKKHFVSPICNFKQIGKHFKEISYIIFLLDTNKRIV